VAALFSDARITRIAFGSANIVQLIHYNEDVLNGAIHPGQAPPKLARPARSAVTGLAPDRAEQEVAEAVYRGFRCQPALAPHAETQSFFTPPSYMEQQDVSCSRVLSFLFHRGEYR
jgi:hypothetical protein